MSKRLRAWFFVILAALISLWAIFFNHPQMMLIAIAVILTVSGIVYIFWRQLNYKWRMILAYGFISIFASIMGGYIIATAISFLVGLLNISDISFSVFMILGALISASVIVGGFIWPFFLLVRRQNLAAEKYLSFLLKLFPKRVMYLSWRGTVRQELLQFDAALSDYRAGIQIATEKKRARNQLLQMFSNRAAILLWRGQVDAAQKDINSVLDLNPNYTRALRVKSHILTELNDLEAALKSAEYAVSLNPKDIEALTNHADILAKLQRKEEAVAAIRSAQALMPNEVTLYTNLSSILVQSKAYEEAIAAANDGLSRSPEPLVAAILIHNRCVALRKLGRYDEVMASYKDILDKNYPAPFDKQIMGYAKVEQGIIYFMGQDYEKAKMAFSQAYEASPSYAVSLLGLAITQYSNNEHEAAYHTWEQFKNIPTRFHNLERLEREGYLNPEMLELARKIADERGLNLLTA